MSLRARLTLVATAVAAIGLGLAGIFIQILLERTLLSALEESARSHASDIATLVEADRLTNPLPSSGAAIAQVIDAENRVVASTPGGDQLAPIVAGADLDAVRTGDTVDMPGTRLGLDEPFLVVAADAEIGAEAHTVLVAVSLEEQQRTADLLKLAAGGVATSVVAAVAALTWFITGRTLQPVEQLRQGAAEITGTGERRLLPIPAGRDELHRLAVTLNDMLDRLEAASARQRAFVADAAHELRSPIAALRTELEVALAHPEQVDPYETGREALAEVERMAQLVDDLLVLARLDERTVHTAHDLDLREIVGDVVESLREPSVRVTIDGDESVAVRGDRRGLARMVRNLLDNAVRHAATTVELQLRQAGERVELRVANDGPPIPDSDRERVFERFTRLDDARSRDSGGAGLGLAIVREIAVSHSGSVWVEDGPAGGACFVVDLPATHIDTSP